MLCNNNHDFQKTIKQSKARRKIQWNIYDENLDELFKDLGIIGKISNDDDCTGINASLYTNIELAKPTKDDSAVASVSESSFDDELNYKPFENLKADLSRIQHQRKRCYETPNRTDYRAKISKIDDNLEALEVQNKDEVNNLPNEVLLKIFGYCSSYTKVICSAVCKRWNVLAFDGSLWYLAGDTIDINCLKALLEHGTKVLSLNRATVTVAQPVKINHHVKSLSTQTQLKIETNRLSSKPYFFLHSLDLSYANIPSKTLCQMLTRCKQLRNISLEGLDVTSDILGCIEGRYLLQLNLCQCQRLSYTALERFLPNCVQLTDLNLAWTNLRMHPPSRIIKALPASLQRVNLSGFRKTIQDYDIDFLTYQCRLLVEVDLSDSNDLTWKAVMLLVRRLPDTLQAVNFSRCYNINCNSYQYFIHLPHLTSLEVFGVLGDEALAKLASLSPKVEICKRPFSTIARPSPASVYGTRRATIWGLNIGGTVS